MTFVLTTDILTTGITINLITITINLITITINLITRHSGLISRLVSEAL